MALVDAVFTVSAGETVTTITSVVSQVKRATGSAGKARQALTDCIVHDFAVSSGVDTVGW